MRNWLLAATLGAAAWTLVAAAQTTTQPAPPSSTQPDQHWADTIQKLSSDQFSDRQAGQKELAKATWRDRDTLGNIAAAATDPDVLDALAARLDALDEQIATNPPPISLDLDNAAYTTMVNRLGKSLGIQLQPAGGGNKTYTIHAVDRPFSEVFLALSAQCDLVAMGRDQLLAVGNPPVRRGVPAGPFLAIPLSIDRKSTTDLQAQEIAQARSETTMFYYSIIVDPRVAVLNYEPPHLVSMTDDQDEDIPIPTNGAAIRVGGRLFIPPHPVIPAQWMFTGAEPLTLPPGTKKLSSVKGECMFDVALTTRSVEVADMQKQATTPIDLAGLQITFTEFRVHDQQLDVAATVKEGPGAPREPGMGWTIVMVRLIDATGREVASDNIATSWKGPVRGSVTPPIKAIFSVATKTRQIQAPFEFKDLPVP